MIPTLKIGDFLFVNKLAYALKLPIPYVNANLLNFGAPQKGDVVVFIFPGDRNADYIKRVVGTPGDTIEVRDAVLYINGVASPRKPYPDRTILSDQDLSLREYYDLVQETTDRATHLVLNDPTRLIGNDFGPIEVPQGKIFCMGDNRDNSFDSRGWGFVPIEDVRGQAKFIWLSLDFEKPLIEFHLGSRTIPIPNIRWDRFGMKIR